MADVTIQKEVNRIILEALVDAMKQTKIKSFFDDEPGLLADNQLPAIIVDWEQSDTQAAPTRSDRWEHRIVIKTCVNKMDDAEVTQNKDTIIEVPSRQSLQKLVYARNADTGDYLPNTVIGVLRKNFSMGGSISDQIASIQFGVAARPNGEQGFTRTREAHIVLTAKQTLQVAGRT